MIIKSIELQNFRNYEDLNISFDEGTNIFYGDNAQGKTNILEAAYLSGTTKSHKCSKDKEMIRFGEQESHIRTVVVKKEKEYQIDMHLKHNRSKGIAINKVPIKKASELFGILNMVFFSPEDLSIIKNGPSERRRFLDLELCQLSRLYYQNLSSYSKILNQRNNLLKQIVYNKSLMDTLDVWNIQLVDYGKKVIKERQNFIMMLNNLIGEIHSKLTSGKEKLEIIYDKNVSEDEFEKVLADRVHVDLNYMSTQTGPHRDDIMFMINGIDARRFGSQGQQRTVALSLKIAEIKLVKNIINDNPILLLDDVMSELDSSRREALLEEIKDIQTIITCTGYDDFIKEQVVINNVYHVINGTVKKI
mgnify:CR=1 FL=1